jgi:hypothetical protein
VCPKRWQRLHWRGPYGASYVFTLIRRRQISVSERTFSTLGARCQRTILPGVLFRRRDLIVHGLHLPPISCSGMNLPRFFYAYASVFRKTDGMKTHTLTHTNRTQGADSGPEAVRSLGHQHQVFTLHLDHKLALGLGANPVQKPARVPHPRHVHGGFNSSFPWGRHLLFHLGGGRSAAKWRVTQRPAHIPGWVGRGALFCFFHRSSGDHTLPEPLAVGLSDPLGLLWRRGKQSGVHQRWSSPWCPFHLWGT